MAGQRAAARAAPRAADEAEGARRDDLEAAKEAKYREIRDAELDHRTGKLSEADWRALDRELRAEAVEILRAPRRAGPDETPPAPLAILGDGDCSSPSSRSSSPSS